MVHTRALGWVQNPSNFDNLKLTVQIFDKSSTHHSNLKTTLLDAKIEDINIKNQLKSALDKEPLTISYSDLVGTGTTIRAKSKCNSLIQASITDQGNKRGYIDNWSSDGFLRWAECLNFIQYSRKEDTFSITDIGLRYSKSSNEDQDEILINRLLAYPPATRILEILDIKMDEYLSENKRPDNNLLATKFELGSSLSFSGENGFTSLPEYQIVEALHLEKSNKEKGKIRSDWEGSSDKYARMISKWLVKLGLVTQSKKYFYFEDDPNPEFITHSFKITPIGSRYLKNSKGNSRHPQIEKYVSWEMLATKAANRNYIRTRRAYTLDTLMNNNDTSLETIVDILKRLGFNDPTQIIQNDITGLVNCGIRIHFNEQEKTYTLLDKVYGLNIPNINLTEELVDKELQEQKANLIVTLPNVDKKYIELVEIAFDPIQNRLLEMQVMELLREEYGLSSKHLGGSRKPDGVAYYSTGGYGIIVDTKAYKKGYPLPISQADEMRRYVEENNVRNLNLNNNEWWKEFSTDLNTFYFLFVSGKFIGSFENRLENIYHSTNIKGGAINIIELLYGANAVKENNLSLEDIPSYFDNKEIILSH